jgi:CheY-like chemotaxis protein
MSGYSLENARVLVVDGNRNMRRVVGTALRALGVGTVTEAADGGEAFDMLRRSPADIILCDRCTRPVDGFAFVRMVRNAADSPNPFAAVIMQSIDTAPYQTAAARAAGVHDILGKPISAKALYARIRALIEYPRPFIRTAEYFGANHRREQTDFMGLDRRRTPPRAAETDAWGNTYGDDPSVVLTAAEIRAIFHSGDGSDEPVGPAPPDLREPEAVSTESEGDGSGNEPLLIPVPVQFQLKVAFSPQGIDDGTVMRADAVIRGFQNDYLAWVQEDLARLQNCFESAWGLPPDARVAGMRAVFDAAYDVAGQGGTFGYPMITGIGAQLCRFIDDQTFFGEAQMRAVHLHIDAMRVIMAERLDGDGGHHRDALIQGLRAILAKMTDGEERGMVPVGVPSRLPDRRKWSRFPTM